MSTPFPTHVHLPAIVAGRIASHGLAIYPEEACGILIGIDQDQSRHIVDAIALNNNWPRPEQRHHRFTIDPKRQMEIEKSLEGTGKSIVGSFHTHPDHPAEPSDFDLDSSWPYYTYLILSIREKRIDEFRAWIVDNSTTRFMEQSLITQPSTQQLQSDP